MKQEFSSSIGGDVAGRDITHQLVNGPAGAIFSAGNGGTLNFNMAPTTEARPQQETSGLVRQLMRTSEEANCREAMVRINQALFGETLFRALNQEQLLKLTAVANELRAKCAELERSEAQINSLLQETANLRAQIERAHVVRRLWSVSPAGGENMLLAGFLHSGLKALALLVLFLAFLGMVAKSIGYTPILAGAVNESLTVCISDWRVYAPGAVIEGHPNQKCALTEDGHASWQDAPKHRLDRK